MEKDPVIVGHQRAGSVRDDPVYPGRISATYFGEGPQRGLYQRWLEFMTSDTSPHVLAPATAD